MFGRARWKRLTPTELPLNQPWSRLETYVGRLSLRDRLRCCVRLPLKSIPDVPYSQPLQGSGVALLHHMRQLVCQQLPAFGRARGIPAGGEVDVPPGGEGMGVHRPRPVVRAAVVVDVHATEVLSKMRLHESPRAG